MTRPLLDRPADWLRRIFVNRNVGLLWTGQVISETGSAVYRVAFTWLAYELTGSKTKAGVILMLGSLPMLLLGPYVGAIVDRFDRRRAMLVSDLARALLVLTVPAMFFLGVMNVWLLGVLTFGVATFNALYRPARDTLVGQLVRPDQRQDANAMVMTSWQYAMVAGPLLAALLLLWLSEPFLFLLDAMTYVVSFLLIWRIASSGRAFRRPRPAEFLRVLTGSGSHTLEGLRYVASCPPLRALVIITAVDNFFLMGPAMLGVPIFVKDELGLDIDSYALVGVAAAAGMIVATVLLRKFGRGISGSKLLLWGIILDGVTFVPMLWVNSLASMFVAMMVHFLAVPLIVICRPVMIQNRVPDNMQGRVFSLVSTAVFGFSALSMVVTGVLAEFLPIGVLYAGAGVLAAATGAVGWLVGGFRGLEAADQPADGPA